ncbi:MAG: hypothetical protein LBI05_04865 [Planctomycetaceae bacterium]|jgi:Flp pilus assembly protein CpaB|nr:hypothetical protein [Planctomycetaceae bacterium]
MRLHHWLILVLAFSVGMGCALAMRAFHFEAAPVVQKNPEPTTKILIAAHAIPVGVEITADLVTFQEVALSEVPLGALSNFAQVYRRQPAYPIPAGCSVCEDLLLPDIEPTVQATFVPAGSQFVTLDIVRVLRQGKKGSPPKHSLSTVLAADQRVDIRVIPRNEGHGRLTDMKNEVLRNFAARDFRNSGELILESVPIHQIQSQSVVYSNGSIKDSLVLLLDASEAAKLSTAARKGQIRVLIHQEDKNTTPQESEKVFEMAEQPPNLTVSLPVEQPLPLEAPPMPEQSPPTPMETVSNFAHEPVDVFDFMLSPAPAPVDDPLPNDIAQFPAERYSSPHNRLAQLPEKPTSFDLPDGETNLGNSEIILIQNDVPAAEFRMPPQTIASEPPVNEPEPVQENYSPPPVQPMMESPRITQSIHFLTPENVAARREQQEMAKQVYASTTVSVISPLPLPTAENQTVSTLIPSEKMGVLGNYSPFERRFEHRIFTVQSSGEGDVIPIPPPLLRGTHTE